MNCNHDRDLPPLRAILDLSLGVSLDARALPPDDAPIAPRATALGLRLSLPDRPLGLDLDFPVSDDFFPLRVIRLP